MNMMIPISILILMSSSIIKSWSNLYVITLFVKNAENIKKKRISDKRHVALPQLFISNVNIVERKALQDQRGRKEDFRYQT